MNEDIAAVVSERFGPGRTFQPVGGGRSGAQLVSFEAGGKAYVARKFGFVAPREPERFAREVACMRIASELGVAPRFVHADIERGVVVMEKIPGAPVFAGTPRETDPIGRLARTLRTLHQGPAFPAGPDTSELLAHLRKAHPEAAGADLPQPLIESLARVLPLAEAAGGARAQCHRDLNPTNLLATADRVYLIDWEVAGQGDPFFDLAQAGIWICRGPDERAELLERYLTRAPSEAEQRRMEINRVLALGFYAASFSLLVATEGGAAVEPRGSLREVFERMARTGKMFTHPEMAAAFFADHLREASACGLAG